MDPIEGRCRTTGLKQYGTEVASRYTGDRPNLTLTERAVHDHRIEVAKVPNLVSKRKEQIKFRTISRN